ncbi:hypothetical protein BH23ACT5_BH23ACT5_19180 [soil metagenome]
MWISILRVGTDGQLRENDPQKGSGRPPSSPMFVCDVDALG